MKKRFYLLFLFGVFSNLLFSQLNMTLISNLDYTQGVNDIWGYADPDDGTEYALVGLVDGLSIVSLADPANPVEVKFIAGVTSGWRDIKTHETYAYVSNESDDGILVVDLSGLPDASTITSYNWQPTISGETLTTAHNLYVDTASERLFIAGADLNMGGVLIADVGTDPYAPQYIGKTPDVYAHDVYAKGNTVYNSEIYEGLLTIYDISDLNNVQTLGSTTTPFDFTHNAWLSDNSEVVFTTDEVNNAPVAAYDISDLGNITKLDEYRPLSTLNEGVAPHNVHVLNDWLVISHYTDGVKIVDAARPDNLIEVGAYDTYDGPQGGFSGAWGAYPFLPSGRVLVSDRTTGLYVLGADYKRAAYLEGTVTDAVTNGVLSGVNVQIVTTEANLGESNLLGVYKTGLATTGTYDVTYSKPGYYSKTVSVQLKTDQLTLQNIALDPLPIYSIAGQLVNSETNEIIPNTQITLQGGGLEYITDIDANGNFSLDIFEGTYTIEAIVWGYHYTMIQQVIDENKSDLLVPMQFGYKDDFVVDYGWNSTPNPNNSRGQWERGVPIEALFGGEVSSPGADVSTDIGDQAYITQNKSGSSAFHDINDGTVVLNSPVMDLTSYIDPILQYRPYFYNTAGNTTPNDNMQVILSNGMTEVTLETITASSNEWKINRYFRVNSLIAVTDNMTLRFEASDFPEGHIVEAGVDAFIIEENDDLPLDASYLNGESKQSGNALFWSEQAANTVSHYDIERSADGVDFLNIGRVTSLSADGENYTYQDHTPLPEINIYRLLVTLEDGTQEYSNSIVLHAENSKQETILYPNPTTTILYFKNTLADGDRIKITDTNGKIPLSKMINNEQAISVDHLSVGIYQLEIWRDGQVIGLQRFIKQ